MQARLRGWAIAQVAAHTMIYTLSFEDFALSNWTDTGRSLFVDWEDRRYKVTDFDGVAVTLVRTAIFG